MTGDIPVELADGQLDDPFASVLEAKEEGGRLTETVVLNRVAVYPLQVRAAPLGDGVQVGANGHGLGPAARVGDVTYRHSQEERWHAMEEIAARTGGRAFRWQTMEQDGFAAAAGVGSHFYTVTYRSTSPAKEGGRRALKVETVRDGFVVEAPNGYVVRSARPEEKAPLSAAHARVMIRAALEEHATPRKKLVFSAKVEATGMVLHDPKGRAPTQENGLAETLRVKGYRMLRIDYQAEAAKMHFAREADGRLTHTIFFYAMLYDGEGKMVNSLASRISEKLADADYEQEVRSGLHGSQMLAVPVQGTYVLRLAVFDPEGPVMGTVEVQEVRAGM